MESELAELKSRRDSFLSTSKNKDKVRGRPRVKEREERAPLHSRPQDRGIGQRLKYAVIGSLLADATVEIHAHFFILRS